MGAGMTDSRNRTWFGAAASVGIAAFAFIAFTPQVRSQSTGTAPQYTDSGQLKLPVGFETWVFVGSNLGLAYKEELPANTKVEAARANQQQFHNIYINPEAYAYFLANKEFPDRTVLVMDVFTAPDREPKNVLTAGFYNGKHIGTGGGEEPASSRRQDHALGVLHAGESARPLAGAAPVGARA